MHLDPCTADTSLLPVLQGVARKWTETKQHVKLAGDEAVMAHMKACTAEQLLSTACELEERAAKARRQAAKVKSSVGKQSGAVPGVHLRLLCSLRAAQTRRQFAGGGIVAGL